MGSHIRKAVAAGSVATLAVLSWAVFASADGNHATRAIEGTWRYTISDASGLPPSGIVAFLPRGEMISIDQRAVAGPGQATTGLGAWRSTGAEDLPRHLQRVPQRNDGAILLP